jgi:DNA topoisomerase-1
LPTGAKLDTVTLEQALEMFTLPRTVGTTEAGEEIKANIGRFGPYIQIGKTYASIKPPLDPHTISERKARELYAAKLEQEAKKLIQEFPSGIRILNGPYGPYVTDGKKNARLPKETKPEKLTEAECRTLLENAPAKRRAWRKRSAPSA